MNKTNLTNYIERFGLAALMALACASPGLRIFAQTPAAVTRKPSGENAAVAKAAGPEAPAPAAGPGREPGDDQLFKDIYYEFYDTYRLGPADEIAIRVIGQPDYTLERVKVSSTGSVYHPLLGDLEVAGMTVRQLVDRLTKDLGEYLINPKVSAALIEANSAKIGVLGDVVHPGIQVMGRPMSLLEAITAAGGFNDNGSKSGVTVLRQSRGGGAQTMTVNVKRILDGKAGAEENIAMQAGDTVIVHGNTKKKLAYVMSLTGFGNFLYFVSR